MQNEDYLTASEARNLMGVTQFKMTQLLKTGELPSERSLRDGRVRLIKRSDMEAWIARAGPRLRKQEEKQGSMAALAFG